jgi:hypothetical protein
VVRGKIIVTEEIPSYAAVALAGLGWLPDTILSRSVIVRMRCRAPDEKIESFGRRLHLPQGEELRRRLAAWAEAVLQEETDARPKMPASVEDRNADVWEALLGVALADNVFAKGYARDDLHDVWRRYLPPPSDEPVTDVTAVTAQSFHAVGPAGDTLQAPREPAQASQNAVGRMGVTDSVAACNASIAPDCRQKMEVVADVTPVTLSPGKGGGPNLSRLRPEAGKVEGDGTLKPLDPRLRRTRI